MGIEGAGQVIEAGPASRLRPGTIVAIPSGGTWSERLAFADDAVLPLPAEVDMEQAAMLCVNPFTAVGLLEGVPEGGTNALNAGSAAVSRLALALARRRGLRALAVVRDAAVADERIAAGATAVLEDGPDLSRRLREAAGAPILRGLDAVAGSASGRLFDALSDGGELVVYGLLSSDRVDPDRARAPGRRSLPLQTAPLASPPPGPRARRPIAPMTQPEAIGRGVAGGASPGQRSGRRQVGPGPDPPALILPPPSADGMGTR